MRKGLIVVGIISILLITGLSGCEENTSLSDEDKIIGTWVNSEIYEGSTRTVSYIFLSDKTFEIVATYEDEIIRSSGTWRIVDDKLVFDIAEPTTTIMTSDYNFSNNFNTLTITDSTGNTMNLTKT